MQNNESIKPKIVETYAEDMAKVIEDDRGGLIKKIIHSEEEHEIEKLELSPESKKNRTLMFSGLIFILTALALFSFLFFNRKSIYTVPIERQFVPIIFNDQNVFLEIQDLKKDAVVEAVLREVKKTEIKDGGVEGIFLSAGKKVVGLQAFLTLIKSGFIPNEDNFVSNNFLMGVVKGETKDFFILFKIRDLADVFNSLRAWEKTMFFDLHRFFGLKINVLTKDLLTANFEDGFIKNKNARILYSLDDQPEKKIIMTYIFADDTSIIITNTENAAGEIILRLAASRVKK